MATGGHVRARKWWARMDRVDEGAAARRERRTARWVTGSVVGVLLLAAAAEAEIWPVTAFRLFSTVRTAHGAATTLVAVAPDGARTVVPMPRGQLLATTSHQLARLDEDPPQTRHDKVVAWFGLAGLDPADFDTAVVERTPWTMDARTHERTSGTPEIVTEVDL